MRPIVEVAQELGLDEADLEPYGRFKAKVHLELRDRLAERPDGQYVAVTAITPTPLGEGKTVTALGLAQALHRGGRPAVACIRQPSLGPTFGVKGGGAGGGAARVVPTDEVNLHLTGDGHAVTAAHNLLAAALDAHLYHANALGIDPATIQLKRVLDVNDRALRDVVTGLGQRNGGLARQTGFEITAASEVMAILALATDRDDLRARLGRMVVGSTRDGRPVSANDLRVAGAMAALLKDALLPNLLQTAEGTPVFVHAGPFANVSLGNSSVLADRLALKLADYVVTECGFGAELGLEKLADIKCRAGGLAPACVVLVATVRALKVHGGATGLAIGKALPAELEREDLPLLERGCVNLVKQVENARAYGVPVVVAINAFPTDTPAELELVRRQALEAGAVDARPSRVYADGGAGGLELAEAVAAACRGPAAFRPLYADGTSSREQIELIARRLYGAEGVDVAPGAGRELERLAELGFGSLPVCVAKTQLSLSHDPTLLGAPRGFRLPVERVRPAVGAGFLTVLCGEIQTMPGLSKHPGYERVEVVGGEIVGL